MGGGENVNKIRSAKIECGNYMPAENAQSYMAGDNPIHFRIKGFCMVWPQFAHGGMLPIGTQWQNHLKIMSCAYDDVMNQGWPPEDSDLNCP